jgi:hypothetical protein
MPPINPPVHRTLLRAIELAMVALFFYLGITKLVGIGSMFQYATGALELIAAALFSLPFLSRSGTFVLTGIVAAIAIIEVVMFKRPPAAAAACLSAHSFVTWGRRQNARWQLEQAA